MTRSSKPRFILVHPVVDAIERSGVSFQPNSVRGFVLRERRFRDVVWYQFEALERSGNIVTAVSTRHGGVSAGVYSTMNLSYSVGDAPGDVEENRRRFGESVGVSVDQIVTSTQVHGKTIANADDFPIGSLARARIGPADGIISSRPGVTVSMNFADCVPLLLVDEVRRVVGLAHAGWRGTFAGIAGEIVRAMSDRYGTRPRDLCAAIGPSIGPCCYTVGAELLAGARLRWAWSQDVIVDGGPGGRLDLWEANVRQLVETGLDRDRIDVTGMCTACHKDLFYSHRAQSGRAGRFAALISVH